MMPKEPFMFHSMIEKEGLVLEIGNASALVFAELYA